MAISFNGAHSSRFSKDSSNFWIHLDVEVSFLSSLSVPLIDSVIDPICERPANNGIDNVGDVLPRELVHLHLGHRERHHHIFIGLGELQEVFNS